MWLRRPTSAPSTTSTTICRDTRIDSWCSEMVSTRPGKAQAGPASLRTRAASRPWFKGSQNDPKQSFFDLPTQQGYDGSNSLKEDHTLEQPIAAEALGTVGIPST